MAPRRFEFQEGTSNKFWEIWVEDAAVMTRYGRIGADGQTTRKDEGSAEKANALFEKLIREKTKKGYVEKGATAAPAPAPAPAAKKKPAGKTVTVRVGARAKHLLPLPGGQVATVDEEHVLRTFDASGKKLGEKKFSEKHTTPRVTQAGAVLLADGDVVLEVDAKGKATTLAKVKVVRAVPLTDGTVVAALEDGSIGALDGSRVKAFAAAQGRLAFVAPVDDARVATTRRVEDRKVMQVYSSAGKELGTAEKKASSMSSPVSAGAAVAFACDDVLLVLNGAKVKKVSLGAKVGGSLSGDAGSGTFAVPVVSGHMVLVDAKGKATSVLRDAPEDGENKSAALFDREGHVLFASAKGVVHRATLSGDLVGAFGLGKPMGTGLLAQLDDGTIVAADDAGGLHFFQLAQFGAAQPVKMKDLGPDREELTKHFASWAVTPDCCAVLEALLQRLTKVDRKGKTLTLSFLCDDRRVFSVEFGAPGKKSSGLPASYDEVTKLHGTVRFGDGVPDELDFGSFNLDEELPERFLELCDAGQNWLVFDTKKKNKLGEPCIALHDHGMGIEEASIYPEQLKKPYGVPGHLLRALGYRVLENDKRFSDFSWG